MRERPKTIVWRPARRNGSAQRWASVSDEPAGARGGVDDRRVHEQQVALAGRGSAAVHDERDAPRQQRRELAGVRDRGRARDDDRMRAVVRAQAQEAPQDVGDVAAEQAAIGVQLVDHDDLQLLEELEPLRVVGEDRGVEHVRVRDHDLARGPDRRADRRGRVAVVGGGRDGQARRRGELPEGDHLVLPEGLGREEPEGAGGRVVGQRLEDRQLVAEALAGGGRGHHADVAARANGGERLALVGVEGADALLLEGRAEAGIEPRREGHGLRLAGGRHGVVQDAAGEGRLVEDPGEDRRDVGRSVRAHGGQLQNRTDVRKCAESTTGSGPRCAAR